jgi:PUB domain/Agenet domain
MPPLSCKFIAITENCQDPCTCTDVDLVIYLTLCREYDERHSPDELVVTVMQDARAGAEPIGSAAVAMATLSGSGISRKLLRLDNRAGLIRVSAHIEAAAAAAAAAAANTHATTDTKHASANKTYYAGDKIEARYKGRTRYYPGVIRRANRDGTYDIDYDDGEKELSVDAELIKLASSNSSDSKRASSVHADRPNSRDVTDLRVGTKISARYRGRDKYYAGTISHVNRDGTYDINYDDGEKELSVLAEFIKQSDTAARSPTRRISSDNATASSNTNSSKPMQLQLQEGDAVTARYRGRERYYSGVVRRVNRDGTYDINYDDGEKELSVLPEYIKSDSKNASSSSNNDKTAGAILEGDAVEARYRGRERWYAGVVRRVNRDGTYDINYNDGEREVGIAAELVRLLTNSINNSSSSKKATADTRTAATVQLHEGDKIEARYKGRSRYYSGTIKRANRDGTYDINYDDGERELSVDAELIRSLETAVRSSPNRGTARTDSIDDNTNNIGSSAKAVDFIAGDKIEARYKGRERYYSGTVRRANRDGTYDIDYDDGEKELSVAAKLIRLTDSVTKSRPTVADSSKKPIIEVLEGDAVEARYRGRERWYAGIVRRVNRDGTYDINYDDGERELGVAAALVRAKDDVKRRHDSIDDSSRGTTIARTAAAAAAAAAAAYKPREGDRVEARYKGRTRYYSGVIRRAHRDGTSDIDYDDGEKELSVDAELVRLLDRNSSSGITSATAAVNKAAYASVQLHEGDKIEARYKGRERWFAGTIRRVNRDGSYDINYDDGERELGVAAELVRLIGTSSNTNNNSSRTKVDVTVQLREGDKIEARYKGRERYFPGTVKRVNRDDTYDINYDDGERELGVEARLVRLIDSNSANSSSSNKPSRAAPLELREGDKIEARYHGRDRWFAGVIKRVHRDDTYDIAYDDGDKELSVAVDFIRLISNSGSSSSSSKYAADSAAVQLREGDKIEARYKGHERWFAGVIKRSNRDDTYDIAYDDGEREVGVEARLVRLVTDNNRSSSSSRTAAVELVAGDKIQARYRGRERYYSGTVRRVNCDGTYDINYDDGEKELSVAAEYVKLTAVVASPKRRSNADSDAYSNSNKPAVLLVEGHKIEARYKGRDRYYTGVVGRANRDGTYDIDYDGGERERSVSSDLIRLLKQPATSAANDRRQSPERRAVRSDSIDSIGSATDSNKLVKGAAVEAAYKGRDRYYTGRIAHVHRDGSCDVDYDDGEQEQRVSKHLIRLKAKPAAVANKRNDHRNSGRHDVQQRDSSKRTARTGSSDSDSISDSSIDNGHARTARGATSSSKQRSTSPHRSATATATARSSSKQRDSAGTNSDSDASIELTGKVSEIAAELVKKYGKKRGLHNHHSKIVSTIATGQTAADVARLKKVRAVFEELSDKHSTSSSGLMLAGDVWRIAVATNADAHSVKHTKTQFATQADTNTTVNLVTVIAALGFLFNTSHKEQHPIAFNTANTNANAAATATSIHAAVALLKLHATTPEVRQACDTVLRLISNMLREPTAQQYWCISSTNDVYNARVANYTGGTLLMNAAGFIKLTAAATSSSEWFVLSSAIDNKSGKLTDKLSDKALITLRAVRDELKSELSLLDSAPSIIEAMRQLRQTCSTKDATIAAEAVLTCIHNVLSKPTDARVRSIRASNSVYMNQIGRHKAGAQLIAAAGFTLCKGNSSTTDDVFALKDDTATSTTAAVSSTTVAQPLSESTLAVLIRRKQALETYIDELREHSTSNDIPLHAATMKAPSSTVTFGTATNSKSKQQHQLSKTVPARNIKSALKRVTNTKHSGNSNNSSSTAGVSSLQMQLLRQSFSALDASKNGKLSSIEVKAALKRMGRDASDNDVANWIQSRDINQDGAISIDEFIASFNATLTSPTKRSGNSAFSTVDDSLISEVTSVSAACGALRLAASISECKAAAEYVQKIIDAVLQAPSTKAYWQIARRQPDFHKLVGRFPSGIALMQAVGYRLEQNGAVLALHSNSSNSGGTVWSVVPHDVLNMLKQKRLQLSAHIESLHYPATSDIAAVTAAFASVVQSAAAAKAHATCTTAITSESSAVCVTCIEAILKYISNIIEHPTEKQYRHINTANTAYQKRVGTAHGGLQLLIALGFREVCKTVMLLLILYQALQSNDITECFKCVLLFTVYAHNND